MKVNFFFSGDAEIEYARPIDTMKHRNMAFRHLETLLHRLHQSRFLRRPEGRLSVLRAIRYLKHHLSGFVQIACYESQDTENEFALHFDTLKHRFIVFTEVVF
jgi:hypothetical protein